MCVDKALEIQILSFLGESMENLNLEVYGRQQGSDTSFHSEGKSWWFSFQLLKTVGFSKFWVKRSSQIKSLWKALTPLLLEGWEYFQSAALSPPGTPPPETENYTKLDIPEERGKQRRPPPAAFQSPNLPILQVLFIDHKEEKPQQAYFPLCRPPLT